MADPITLGTMAVVSMGASAAGGVAGAVGAGIKARGEQLGIEGQMLTVMGKAYQFDVEANQYMWKSGIEKYQAAVARLNREIALENANYERDKGEVEAQALGMRQRYDLGQVIASQGASGIAVDSPSFQRVRSSMIDIGYHDQMITRANAARLAYGFEVQAVQYEAQAAVHSMTADLDKAQAESATTAAGITRAQLPMYQEAKELAGRAGAMNAIASLTGAAGSVANKWMGSEFQGLLKG